MNDPVFEMELLSQENIYSLISMALELWPDGIIEEEFEAWKLIVNSQDDFCALAKYNNDYVGFIHIAIRSDYVEGSHTKKTPYLEAIYTKTAYRQRKIAGLLLDNGEIWAKEKGFTQLASDTELENFSSREFHGKVGFKEVGKIVCYLKSLY